MSGRAVDQGHHAIPSLNGGGEQRRAFFLFFGRAAELKLINNTPALLNDSPVSVHDCCVKHDRCYDSRLEQSECDHGFCACLALLPYNGLFCDLAAHKGLCLATHVFGHMFYEAEAENGTAP